MNSLLIGGDEYKRSVAFDATEESGTLVTVGVAVTREQEAQLLNICCDEQNEQYKPFATKSRQLNLNEVPVGELIRRFPGRIAIGRCTEPPNQDLQAEAAHSAVLYNKLNPFESATAVIADGDERQAERLGRALKTLRIRDTPAVPCHRSESYYPQSYFADLLAAAIARDCEITSSDLQEECELWTAASDNGDRFWEVYNKVGAGRHSYQVPTREERLANKQSTRAKAWFNGCFGSNSGELLQTNSTRRVKNWLWRNEYAAAAERIS
ncbi:hypothetical protein [Halobaculum sp. MBLA0143]|uniref:hypothetical protein n=1 Tax=Halobaculum sp. MBLA0143 TaxID=3079933 RepID=UPI003524BA99